MHRYRVAGLPSSVTDEVRSSLKSPGYGHPAHVELATGTGPCRQCLEPFTVGAEDRILFTYRPPAENGTITAPGPVFIHWNNCCRYDDLAFPSGLRGLPLAFEARASGGRVLACRVGSGDAVDGILDQLFAERETAFVFVRHAEAGCYIARVDRLMVCDER